MEANVAAGYEATTAESNSRIAVPLRDLAASTQVVPYKVWRDRGVTRTDQLLDTVSGLFAESTYGDNGATFFNIGGFSKGNGLRNGLHGYAYLALRDVQNIECAEVFKRPGSCMAASARWVAM